jgi:DNA-binding transcriptional ArsR family regulator
VDAVLQALADHSRRTVLKILRDHPATAGELAEALPIARPGVSRHLRVLREAGLVEVRQEAQRRIYSLRPEALVEVDEEVGVVPLIARCGAVSSNTDPSLAWMVVPSSVTAVGASTPVCAIRSQVSVAGTALSRA